MPFIVWWMLIGAVVMALLMVFRPVVQERVDVIWRHYGLSRPWRIILFAGFLALGALVWPLSLWKFGLYKDPDKTPKR